MKWIDKVRRMLVADVGFYYMPKRIVVVIPKTALENNTTLLRKTEDSVNIYLEFQYKDGLEANPDRKVSETGKETPSGL